MGKRPVFVFERGRFLNGEKKSRKSDIRGGVGRVEAASFRGPAIVWLWKVPPKVYVEGLGSQPTL